MIPFHSDQESNTLWKKKKNKIVNLNKLRAVIKF